MKTYISILRGINVSGRNVIKMEALRQLYEALGYRKVTSYVQSGNVVFASESTNTDEIADAITQEIAKRFGLDVPVIVLDCETLQGIIDNNPFANENGKEPAFFHVTFLAHSPAPFDLAAIEAKRQKGEELVITDNAVYLYCPNGYGNSKLSNSFLEAKLKATATTRNWKTTNELLRMAQQTEKEFSQ